MTEKQTTQAPLAAVDTAAVEKIITQSIESEVIDMKDDAKAKILEHMEACRINLADEFPQPRFLISKHGVGTLSRGDIQAVKAKSKNGKTFFTTILSAVALGASFGDWAAEEEGLQVVMFDTEQNPLNVGKVGRRVHRLLGWDEKSNNPRFKCYALRADDVAQRRREIVTYIQERKPDLAIIDGLADLTLDFNNIEESQAVIGELMKLSTEVQCAILFVLHENKSKDDSNMKGHLGTMAVQKCSDVFKVTKTGCSFMVEQTESRNAPVEPFSFILDGNGTPQPSVVQKKQDKQKVEFNALISLLQRVYGGDACKTRKALIEGVINEEGVSNATAKRRITEALSMEVISYSAAGKGYILLDRDKRE